MDGLPGLFEGLGLGSLKAPWALGHHPGPSKRPCKGPEPLSVLGPSTAWALKRHGPGEGPLGDLNANTWAHEDPNWAR